MKSRPCSSAVEKHFIQCSGKPLRYDPAERTSIIEVADFPSLGRLTALRFLEWVLENPEGVVSLPTGKTPEYFIKWAHHYLDHWDEASVQKSLESVGLVGRSRPEMGGLRFVQIDEFYPIETSQRNSFYYYVNKYYLRGLGMDPERALLINPAIIGLAEGERLESVFPDGQVDLSLRSRRPANTLEENQVRVIMAVDQFCSEYERTIRDWGGIGFFLGGIGPDGHIGFNARGSHLNSPTRLTLTNYETEATAAGDLGGIEVSRNKPVITIGLGTITHNKDAVVIIFAAGESKCRVVADAIEQPRHVKYPATVIQDCPHARFYLTSGATLELKERRLHAILKEEPLLEEDFEKAIINRALDLNRRLDQLGDGEVAGDPLLEALLKKTGRSMADVSRWVRGRILARIESGLEVRSNETILHTGPHHDDIMLGYMPYIMHLVRQPSNRNEFCVLTSGFNAVTNRFLAAILEDLLGFIRTGIFESDGESGRLAPDNAAARAADVYRYLDAIAARDDEKRRRVQARRMLSNLIAVYEDESLEGIAERIEESLHYLRTLYPGKKDVPTIQRLKGMQREFEEELIWGYIGTDPAHVRHSRLGFYKGDIFTETPTIERDVEPVLDLLNEFNPTIVSLAFDPEGAGPDTHYKVLQVLSEALRKFHEETGREVQIWGYRNVWHRFAPSEANIYVPTSLNTMAIMENSFMQCFGSQRDASFPSYAYDGPFCHLAQKIWVEQFRMIQVCLGERFFTENDHPRLRATRGFVFLKSMSLDEFSRRARSLARATEATETTEATES